MISQKRTATALLVTCPYNPDFRAAARRLGGEWKAAEKVWSFPLTVADAVENACERIFRVRQANPDAKGLTIRITATRNLEEDRGAVSFSGIPVAEARGRDTGASLGRDCALISGKISSGGSRQYWKTFVKAGSIFEVRNVHPDAVAGTPDWDVEVLGETVLPISCKALRMEKERLLERIKEIDLILVKESKNDQAA